MIEVKNLCKEFVSPKKFSGFGGAIRGLFTRQKVRKTAVDGVSFNIEKGEIVGYIGSNGAGKSTTIKMMTGILTPTSGTCFVDGIEPYKSRKKNAQNIGVVFGQRTQLWWDLPLSESFTILKEIYGVSNEDYKQRIEYLNEVLGLNEFFTQPVRNLSLGQRMRADLGAALIHNPSILYLDEPTIGLDLVVKDNIRNAIKEINARYRTTVILTTHDIGDIEELCNRILIIDHGKLIYDGSLSALKEKYGTTRSVTMEVSDVEQALSLPLYEYLKVDKTDYEMRADGENNAVCITFDKNRLQVSDVIGQMMSHTEVKDIKIHETDLAEIVKAIYRHDEGAESGSKEENGAEDSGNAQI